MWHLTRSSVFILIDLFYPDRWFIYFFVMLYQIEINYEIRYFMCTRTEILSRSHLYLQPTLC